MLAEWAWLAISVLVYPKDVQWGIGKGSVQTSPVLANQTNSNMPLWTLWCPIAQSKAETEKCLNCINHKATNTELSKDFLMNGSIKTSLYWK